MAYFGSSQEEEDLEDEDEEEEEEEVRNGGSVHSQASASSSCSSTPRKSKLPARQPLNGHGKNQTGEQNKACHVFIPNKYFAHIMEKFHVLKHHKDPIKIC